jgi:hypothetical protein
VEHAGFLTPNSRPDRKAGFSFLSPFRLRREINHDGRKETQRGRPPDVFGFFFVHLRVLRDFLVDFTRQKR